MSERNILDESSTILLKHVCTLNIIISLDYKDITSKKLNVLYILRRICLHIRYFYTFFVLLSGLMLAILLLSPSNIIHSNNNVVETYFIQSLPSDLMSTFILDQGDGREGGGRDWMLSYWIGWGAITVWWQLVPPAPWLHTYHWSRFVLHQQNISLQILKKYLSSGNILKTMR